MGFPSHLILREGLHKLRMLKDNCEEDMLIHFQQIVGDDQHPGMSTEVFELPDFADVQRLQW